MGSLYKLTLFLILSMASCLTLGGPKEVSEPSLMIKGLGETVIKYRMSDFLELNPNRVVRVAKDPAYGKEQNYLAIPFRILLGNFVVNPEATIEFECLDGYSAVLDVNELLNVDETHQPYVAFALADGSPLPPSREGKDVGPFYLVWPSPKDGIYKEANWPFNLSGFNFINKSFADQFPKVIPKKWPVSADLSASLREGLNQFRTNCFVCHTMNGEGNAKMGADLKVSGIVKGFDDNMLKQFIRNPKALMPKTKMSAFTKEMLNDSDLDKIVLYLRHMQSEDK